MIFNQVSKKIRNQSFREMVMKRLEEVGVLKQDKTIAFKNASWATVFLFLGFAAKDSGAPGSGFMSIIFFTILI